MAFVNMKAAAFLVGEESLDGISAVIKATGLILVVQIGNQVNWVCITTAPPSDQVDLYGCILSKADLPIV